MRIVSLNAKKGLNGSRGTALGGWLEPKEAGLLLVQEPISARGKLPNQLAGLQLIGGNHYVAAYARGEKDEGADLIDERWLRLEREDVTLDNVYLPHETSGARKDFLDRLVARPTPQRLIVGDFNLAPRPVDGRYGDEESTWTGVGERTAFSALLETGLVDLGAVDEPEFTFQRRNKGKWTRFRCDLALMTETLAERAALETVHRPRNPSLGFTDHSALIVEVEL